MKNRLISMLRWSEKYTKTDMVYLASGAFWGNLNASVVYILAFAASILFANYLSKEAYGMYQYVLAIGSLIGSLTLTGMNNAVTRAVARGHEGEVRHAVRFQVIAGVLPTALGLAVSLWYFLHGNSHLAIAVLCIAIFLPLGNAFNTWAAYMGGKKLFRLGTHYGMSNTIITYSSTLLAIYFGRDFLWVVLASFPVIFLSNFVIYKLVIRKYPPNNLRDDETISYGTHLSLMGIAGVISGQIDSLLVFHFIGAAALAIYSFATIIPERISGLLKFIPNIALPKFSSSDEGQIRKFLYKRLWMVFVLTGLAALGYVLLAPWFFNTFFPAYSESIPYTQVYSLSLFGLAGAIVQMALTSQQKTRELYKLNTVLPIFRTALMAILMFYFGLWGLIWAQIISNFASLGYQLLLLGKRPSPTII